MCFLYCLLLFAVLNVQGYDYNIRIRTTKGLIRGVLITSRANTSNNILAFKGIPYAKAPVKDLRFKAPVTIDSWKGIKILSEQDKPMCPQPNYDGSVGNLSYSEDCLHLNVYCPSNATSDSRLPVMVWIHGGGYVHGSNQYSLFGPDYLVDQNIIVVALNYRLGALGFLSLGTEDAPGNAGLKDQNLALKWVQEEISKFGGDPNNVTIFGESAGSTSVHFHILSNMSKGLFKRAIGDSGVAIAEWALISNGYIERAKMLAELLNCTYEGEVNVTCLQNSDVKDILDHQALVLPEEDTVPGNRKVFAPILDTNITKAPFFTDTLDNLIKDPPSKVPMIMGINKDEGLTFIPTNASFYSTLPSKMQYFISRSTREQINNYTVEEKVKKIESFYFNNTPPSLQNIEGYVNLLTDKMFAVSTAIAATAMSKYTDVYLYHFDFAGNFILPFPVRKLVNMTGPAHADELLYLFISTYVNTAGYSANSAEMKVLRKMVRMWTNFVKFGAPIIGSNDPDSEDAKWISVSENSTAFLIINEKLTMSTGFHAQSLTLWADIEDPVNVSSPVTQSIPTTSSTLSPLGNNTTSPTIPNSTISTSLPTILPNPGKSGSGHVEFTWYLLISNVAVLFILGKCIR